MVNSTLRCHSHSHSLDTKEWAGSADECEVRGLAQARSEQQQEEFIARTTGRETKWKREEQQKTGDPSTAAKILLLAQISL